MLGAHTPPSMHEDLPIAAGQAEILVDRTFSLRRLARHARGMEKMIAGKQQEIAPWVDGSVLPFIPDGYRRALEAQRRDDGSKEMERNRMIYEVRAGIVDLMLSRHGTKASVRQLDLGSWSKTLLGGVIPPPETNDADAVFAHMEWFVKNGVVVPYVARITKPPKMTTAARALAEATEIRAGEDPIDLLERHYTWAILDLVLDEDPTVEEAPGLRIYKDRKKAD